MATKKKDSQDAQSVDQEEQQKDKSFDKQRKKAVLLNHVTSLCFLV